MASSRINLCCGSYVFLKVCDYIGASPISMATLRLPVVYVLMVLAPTTKTEPIWHPFTASPSKSLCETRAPGDMERWDGKTPIKWKCVPYHVMGR